MTVSPFRLLPAVLGLSLTLTGCLPGSAERQYEIPEAHDACADVNLGDGRVDGAAEFRLLFDCINNMGAVQELEPMVDDLATTVNPDTGEVYLEDLVVLTNDVLADEHLGDLVGIAASLVEQGQVEHVLPVAATVIDSGLAHELLPVIQASIESGALAQSLELTALLLRNQQMPALVDGARKLIDDGLAEGWMTMMLPDLATMLTVQNAAGEPALRDVLPPLTDYLTSGNAGGLVPVANELIDTGTVEELMQVTRALADQGVLQEMDTQLRPLMVQDAAGHSDLQGTLEILAGTNQPLKCLGLQITPNLAKMILETMADRTPSDIQNLVSILRSTLGLADLFCALPPAVEAHIDSLDALAQSGALNGLLPMLKVFKQQGQVGLLVDVLVEVHGANALPALEPVIIAAIDAGVVDRMMEVIPHMIDPAGNATPAMASLLEGADLLLSPTDPSDPSTAPATSLLPLLGSAGAGAELALADALYLLGQTIEDPTSGFDAILPAISAALASDQECALLVLFADLIEAGTIEAVLPVAERVLSEGHAEDMLPWTSQMIHDGTADALLQVLSRAFDLMETSG